MLYIYTLLTLAWELDKDTHLYFRKYLDVFIKKHEVLKDFKNLINSPKVDAYWNSWYKCGGWKVFNELRLTLPNHVRNSDNGIIVRKSRHLSIPKLIDEGHPPQLDRDTVVLNIPNLIEDLHPPQYWTDKYVHEKLGIEARKISERQQEKMLERTMLSE